MPQKIFLIVNHDFSYDTVKFKSEFFVESFSAFILIKNKQTHHFNLLLLDIPVESLQQCPNISLICGDFMEHSFRETFDVIYSSLTMMHLENKQLAITKMYSLLINGGLLCLSIDKNQSEWIDSGTRRLRIYPDTPESIIALAEQAGLKTRRIVEIENAFLIVFVKE